MTDSETLITSVAYEFTFVTSVVLTVVGFIGNSISIFIMSRREMRNISMFRYLIFSMLNDSLVLVTMWFYTLPDIFLISSMTCKSSSYLNILVYNYSGWIAALSLTDRLITVNYPTKYKFRNKFKFQAVALLTIFSAMILLSTPYFIYFDTYFASNQTTCITSNSEIQFYVELSGALIGVLIPFIIMITVSTMIGRCLIKKSKIIKASRDLKKEVRLIKMMMTFSVFFLICNLPYYIQQLIRNGIFLYNTDDVLISDSIFDFVYNITSQLCYIYNSSGFFVCLITNNVFRNYFYSKFVIFGKTRVHQSNSISMFTL